MKVFLAIVFLMTSTIATAECTRPETPVLPDGDIAELQAMIDGQQAVQAYVAGAEAYLDCLMPEEESADGEADAEADVARVEEHNAAVDEMEKVAAEFNEEIREYKARAK